jgi:hypothetical protein
LTVRESWPFLDLSTIERLVNVGRIFRQLAAILWASTSLGFETFEFLWWAVEAMRIYHEELSNAIRMAQWEQREPPKALFCFSIFHRDSRNPHPSS